MAGKKGAKWSPDKKKPLKVKCMTSLDPDVYKRVEALANMERCSISHTIRQIVCDWFIIR